MTSSDREARLSWDATWMNVAWAMSKRSRCDRAKVGAVVVTKDQRVNATGYNGPMKGLSLVGSCSRWCPRARPGACLSSDYSSCQSIHAEANAIARANYTDIQGGTIYVSRAMCINCLRLVGNSGIKRIVHVVTMGDSHRNPDAVERAAREAGLTIDRFAGKRVVL